MSSQGGQLPFGYDPATIQGSGLPDFLTKRPTPTGQPLLNENENSNLDTFFQNFDDKNAMFQSPDWQMPPSLLASNTSYGSNSNHVEPNFQFDQYQDMNYYNYDYPMQYTQGWQQYPQIPVPVRFGSDASFQPTHYAAPQGHHEPEMRLEWLEQSSATNTQPNTEPSSPNWQKKRKLEMEYAHKRSKSYKEPSPPTSKSDEDAPAESRSPSPYSRKPKRRKSIVTPRPKPRSRPSMSSTTTRVPLSQEQKKANHTNSEQRRRDATARAYAQLYDLVPELNSLGKQSTMKKLEIVVEKVEKVTSAVTELRQKMGINGTNVGIGQMDMTGWG